MSIAVTGWWTDPKNITSLAQYLLGSGNWEPKLLLSELSQRPESFGQEWEKFQQYQLTQVTDGDVEKVEFFDDRFYKIGNTHYPSATTVLWAYPAPGLTQVIGNLGHELATLRKNIAGQRGSRVHDALSKNSVVNRKEFEDDEWLMFMRYEEWKAERLPTLVLNESVVWYNAEHAKPDGTTVVVKFAGRVDRIVKVKLEDGSEKLILLDFKTGAETREAWLQVTAYARALEMSRGIRIDDVGILYLNANTKKGWKFTLLSEKEDCDAWEAIEREFNVFVSTYFVWQDAFRSLKAKSFPKEPPVAIDLSAPIEVVEAPLKEAPVEVVKPKEQKAPGRGRRPKQTKEAA